MEDGGTKCPAFGKVRLWKSKGGKKLLHRAGMEVEDGAPGAQGWEHPPARGAEEPAGERGDGGTVEPRGWASPCGPRLQQHPSGLRGVAKALKP